MAEEIDAEVVSAVLSAPPFIQIDGLFNLRDISNDSQTRLRSNYCMRCGSFEQITDQGKAELINLGVKTVFDLRSTREMESFPHTLIPGIDVVTTQTETDSLRTARPASLPAMYLDMLRTHQGTFKRVLEHVRDEPDRPFILHCTAGKDRTGVAVALILRVADMPISYIAEEYALTRLGIEPVRGLLSGKLSGGATLDWKDPRIQALVRVDPNVMTDFLQLVQERYGGVVNYVVKELGFLESDVETMRYNLQQ